MSAIAQELSSLLNSGQNLRQNSSNLGLCWLNDPQQQELVQETENAKRSNKGYGKFPIKIESLTDTKGLSNRCEASPMTRSGKKEESL